MNKSALWRGGRRGRRGDGLRGGGSGRVRGGHAVVVCGVLSVLCASAYGQEAITWTGAVDDSWHLAANWDPADVPNEETERAVLGGAAPYVVRFIGGADIVRLTISNPLAQLVMEGMSGVPALKIRQQGMENQGLIRITAPGAVANTLRFIATGASIRGAGEIRLEDTGKSTIQIDEDVRVVHTAQHRISGTGLISGYGLLVNRGAIDADREGGITIFTNVQNNGGVMRSIPPGSMRCGNVDQAGGGVIEAHGSAETMMFGVLNGTLRSVDGGVFTQDTESYIGNVILDGDWVLTVRQPDLRSMMNVQVLRNNGLIRLPAHPFTSHNIIRFYGLSQTIEGTGEIRLEEAVESELLVWLDPTQYLRNGAGHRITGVGSINGLFGATFYNSGTLAPGLPYGTMRVATPLVLETSGAVEIELAGSEGSGGMDAIDATGFPVALGGTLRVMLVDGYELPACAPLAVMHGNMSGLFEELDLPWQAQGKLSVVYSADSVSVMYIPGDMNGDGQLDFADYLEFLNLFDAQDPRADLNGDTFVDFADYLEFLNLYETGC